MKREEGFKAADTGTEFCGTTGFWEERIFMHTVAARRMSCRRAVHEACLARCMQDIEWLPSITKLWDGCVVQKNAVGVQGGADCISAPRKTPLAQHLMRSFSRQIILSKLIVWVDNKLLV